MSVTHFKSHIIAQGGISGAGVMGEPGAVIYYVDEEKGSNSYNGKSPDCAFKTITYAVDKCKNDYSDDAFYYIFVIPGNYVEDDIELWGHGIQLVGLGIPGRDSGVHLVGEAGASKGVIYLAGSNCQIVNMCIEAVGAKPPIYGEVSDNCWIHGNRFHGKTGTTLDLLKFDSLRGSVIEQNQLFTFKEKGLNLNGYFIESKIKDNLFGRSSTGAIGSGAKGIYKESGEPMYGVVIDHNWVLMGDVAGSPKGIDIDATGQILITDNHVVVPNGKTPIECAASPDGILNNHTLAGAVVVDPNPKAST